MTASLSIIIPTLNSEDYLPKTLFPLVHGVLDGLVSEVIIVDGGSTDSTIKIGKEAGCLTFETSKGRGNQLSIAANHAKSPWLLFLHSDTVLQDNWYHYVRKHILACEKNQHRRAGFFKFKLDKRGFKPRVLEYLVYLRCMLFKLPYGDQGLLISKKHYDAIGGYPNIQLMEDVEIIRNIKNADLVEFDCYAVTSAERYEHSGYIKRSLRNLSYLLRYFLGASDQALAKSYYRK